MGKEGIEGTKMVCVALVYLAGSVLGFAANEPDVPCVSSGAPSVPTLGPADLDAPVSSFWANAKATLVGIGFDECEMLQSSVRARLYYGNQRVQFEVKCENQTHLWISLDTNAAVSAVWEDLSAKEFVQGALVLSQTPTALLTGALAALTQLRVSFDEANDSVADGVTTTPQTFADISSCDFCKFVLFAKSGKVGPASTNCQLPSDPTARYTLSGGALGVLRAVKQEPNYLAPLALDSELVRRLRRSVLL